MIITIGCHKLQLNTANTTKRIQHKCSSDSHGRLMFRQVPRSHPLCSSAWVAAGPMGGDEGPVDPQQVQNLNDSVHSGSMMMIIIISILIEMVNICLRTTSPCLLFCHASPCLTIQHFHHRHKPDCTESRSRSG